MAKGLNTNMHPGRQVESARFMGLSPDTPSEHFGMIGAMRSTTPEAQEWRGKMKAMRAGTLGPEEHAAVHGEFLRRMTERQQIKTDRGRQRRAGG